jgi:hypothetical protein
LLLLASCVPTKALVNDAVEVFSLATTTKSVEVAEFNVSIPLF